MKRRMERVRANRDGTRKRGNGRDKYDEEGGERKGR